MNIGYLINRVYDLIYFSISDVTREKFKFIGNSKIEMRKIIGKIKTVFKLNYLNSMRIGLSVEKKIFMLLFLFVCEINYVLK